MNIPFAHLLDEVGYFLGVSCGGAVVDSQGLWRRTQPAAAAAAAGGGRQAAAGGQGGPFAAETATGTGAGAGRQAGVGATATTAAMPWALARPADRAVATLITDWTPYLPVVNNHEHCWACDNWNNNAHGQCRGSGWARGVWLAGNS